MIKNKMGDMMNTTNTSTDVLYEEAEFRGELISWRTITAGVLFAIAIEAALNLFAVGSGFVVLGSGIESARAMTIGGIVWLVLSTMISLFSGAWLAGYLADDVDTNAPQGIIQGIMIWTLTTIISLTMITSGFGILISGTGRLAKNTLSAIGGGLESSISSLSSVVGEQTFEEVKHIIADKLKDTQIKNEDIRKIVPAARSYFLAADESGKAEAKQKIITLVSESSSINRAEAEEMLNKWEQTYQDFYDRASANIKKGFRETSKFLSSSFMILFITNILGAVAAVVGASLGYNQIPSNRRYIATNRR